MTHHLIAYQGMKVSLAAMQESYVSTFVRWINWRTDIEGTLQRPPYSLEMGKEWVRSFDKSRGKDEVFAILEHTGSIREAYRYVGNAGIHRITYPDALGTTGSMIGVRDNQGRGLGTEAKLLILNHAFMRLGLRKLTSTVKIFNAPSVGHLLKCGYKHVGTYHRHHLHEGEYLDEHLFEVFREDWEPIWLKYKETNELPTLTDDKRAFIKKITNS